MEKKSVLFEDIEIIANLINNNRKIHNSNIFITGATGLIGSLLTRGIMLANQRFATEINLFILVRSYDKANHLFSPYHGFADLNIILSDIVKLPEIESSIDYIFHCASITISSEMVIHPVETIATIVDGTKNILTLASRKSIKSMVFLSSMEVYGQISNSNHKTTEDELGYINLLSSRSSYPESKRLAECLCYAYYKEFDVPVKIARLAQTFGPGISQHDARLFSQLAYSSITNRDIVLHTHGNSIGNYCYTTDCINALLVILLEGNDGDVYNIVNERSTMTINEVANLVAKDISNPTIAVKHEVLGNTPYAADTFLKLAGTKLNQIGWHPQVDLKESYIRLIQYLKENSANQESI